MSFENIQLPSSVLSGIYKQVVVTDDYANMPGNPGRKAEETSPVMKTAIEPQQPVEMVPPQQAAGSNPVFPTTPEVNATTPLSVGAPASAVPQMPETAQAPTAIHTTPAPSDAKYRYLGKNARNISVIVHSTTEAYLPESELQLLTKMLDACKLNLGDVAIINTAAHAVHFNQLAEQLHPQKALLFGVQPEQIGLPLSFPPFKEQEYAGCTYLLATTLEAMNQPNEEGKILKGKLWGCLKKMFNI
ncbi:MAG: hypothetical protein ACTHMC_17800 [Pseudobacter sp.]|uniref:hypothetical protein n=1 Tax=Pseudobacter sp. TaxID=2045420 RepID=UPI003F80D262